MGLDIRDSAPRYEYFETLCGAHVMPTILRTYEKLCNALFPEVKPTHIEIENRHAVDASLSLSEISDVQPGTTSYPTSQLTHTQPHTHTHTHIQTRTAA